MAAAGDLIQKMTNFPLKYIAVLVLFQFSIAANGYAAERNEFTLRRAKRAPIGTYDSAGKNTSAPTSTAAATPVVITTTPNIPTNETDAPALNDTTNVTPTGAPALNDTTEVTPTGTPALNDTTKEMPATKPTGSTAPTGTTTPKSTTAPPKGTTMPPPVEPKEVNKNYMYYTSTVLNKPEDFAKYWVDIEKDSRFMDSYRPEEFKALRRKNAMTLMLPWPIIYYGHTLQNVTLAAGGFIHVNPFTTTSLTLAQNIAPLMSDLTRSSNDTKKSGIFMVNNSDTTVFEWRGMEQYKHKNSDGSVVNDTFTFQLHLMKNGTISFLYKSHPIPVANISVELHDVQAGLSDGYFINKWGKSVLVPYSTIDVSDDVKDGEVIIFTPKPTCIQERTCGTCVKVPGFNCKWCATLKRCSDGFDRHRHTWLDSNCKDTGTANCKPQKPARAKGKGAANVGAIIGVFLFVFIVLGTGGWFWYAYRNPTSSSGMCLMTAKTSCCKKGRVSRSSKDYQAFMESDTESLPL